MNKSIVVIFNNKISKKKIDLEIPIDITATELVIALNSAYNLGIDVSNPKMCYLKAENPFTLIKGSKKIVDLGLRDGTIINFTG